MKELLEQIKSLIGIKPANSQEDMPEDEFNQLLAESYANLHAMNNSNIITLEAMEDVQDLMNMIEDHEQQMRDIEGTPDTFRTVFESEVK